MEMETLFIAALQSSFLLGLIHGVNPCGHSWLVLAPFVTGEKRGRRVSLLTASFLGGTALACLLLGATLGTISFLLLPSVEHWVDILTSGLLLLIGIILLYNPEILHKHTHDHQHDCHCHHHDHHHHNVASNTQSANTKQKWLAYSLFGIGFVNMIIPCPTVAVMYGYALNSGNILMATIVFGSYAVSTAIAVAVVIYSIFKLSTIAGRLQNDWIEPLIMRSAGVIIMLFSSYGLYSGFSGV